MNKPVKLKQTLLLLGDIAILYLSLYLTLAIRYRDITDEIKKLHLGPFTAVFALWLLVFYIIGFYEPKEFKNTPDFGKKFVLALFINLLLAISLFYFIPAFGIAPKTNLFLFFVIFGSAAYAWRTGYNNFLRAKSPARKMLLVGTNSVAEELAGQLEKHPQLGYEVTRWLKNGAKDKELERLRDVILENQITTVVVTGSVKKNSKAARLIYQNLALNIEVVDLALIYETIFHKVPLAELEEVWFLENLAKSHELHDLTKKPIEIALSLIITVAALPLIALIIILIKTTSPGSAFFTQTRVGKNGKKFVLWKFRTMYTGAEAQGPQWAKPNDARTTPVGKVLRRAHFDELPQLLNILRGDISLVGPRPERPEFVEKLTKAIPFYDLRHLVRPGITGWAQINYRYGASTEDAYEKLQYDIYYLKHRSFWLDISIIVKTVKRLFVAAS